MNLLKDPPPIEFERKEFIGKLANNILTLEMKEHFPSVESARQKIDNFLRAWEIYAGLQYGRAKFTFHFLNAELIDRNPLPQGPERINIPRHQVTKEFILTIKPAPICSYPEPPTLFNVNSDVETLWYRFELYKKKREELLSMSYFCISFIEYNFGGIKKASRSLKISRNILTKIKSESSFRGDFKTARKVDRQSSLDPLFNQEIKWMEEAIKALIIRIGEYECGNALSPITMYNLPPLKSNL